MHSPQLEWVMTRSTLIPQRITREEGGASGIKIYEEKRKYRDDGRPSVKGTGCGWKTSTSRTSMQLHFNNAYGSIIRRYHRLPHTDC